MPLIKIDERECNGNLLSALRQEKDTIIQICRLPVGDYQVEDLLLVERKTIPDLSVSIMDGRLFRQAIKLSKQPLQSNEASISIDHSFVWQDPARSFVS